ncbi:MAG TPA: hypothetical protein VJM80_01955 [bacterium]|nr:hypothetical protein [bacterium]
MRRATMFMLAVALVVGMTLPALATEVKFNGYYRVRAYSVNNWTANEATKNNSNFFDNRLDLNMGITVNDRLSVFSEFWIHDGEWGTGTSGIGSNDGSGFSVRKAWASYKPTKDFNINLGKQGWGWTSGYNVLMNRKYAPDSIVANWKAGPGTLTLAYGKLVDCSSTASNTALSGCALAATESDADRDLYLAQYSMKAGPATLTPSIMFDRSTDTASLVTYKLYYPRLNGAAKVGPVDLKAEAAYIGGEAVCTETGTASITTFQGPAVGECYAGKDAKYQAWSAYLQGGYTFGFGELGLQYIYASGDGNATDDKVKAWAPSGSISKNDLGQYSAIALRHQDETGLLWYKNGSVQSTNGIGTVSGAKSGVALTNAQVFGAYGKSKVAGGDLLGNVFYAKANVAYLPNQDKDYGTEVSVSYLYPIMKELVLGVSGGYLFAGDYFKGGSSSVNLSDPWVAQWNVYANF